MARARGPLQLVFAAVGLVLLLACVNVANLALVRATGRVHESDPRILVASAGVLAMVSLVAAWLPARRAARVEPSVAMHESY